MGIEKVLEFMDMTEVQSALDGKEVPRLPPGPLGRLRLVEALQGKFGKNFRQVEAARRAIKSFDRQTEQVRGALETRRQIQTEKKVESKRREEREIELQKKGNNNG